MSNVSGKRSSWPFDLAAAMDHISRADPRMGAAFERLGELRYQRRGSLGVFEALMRAIVYQQLSGKAAGTILGRVLDLFPGEGFPDPEALIAMPDDELRAAGLSRNKTLAVKDLASKVVSGEVPAHRRLRRMSEDRIVEHLTKVRGVGRWTAEMFLIFNLGRADVLPVDDLGVRRGFQRVFGGVFPSPERLIRRGERWRPFRTVASCYLWQAAGPPD